MKKLFYILATASAIILASCQKTPIGGTAVEALSGEWYVQVDIVDENGDVVEGGEDFNGGRSLLLTYNTPDNSDNKLYINDLAGFWDFTVKVPCNVANYTFATAEAKEYDNESYESKVSVYGGKIVLGGATTPSGATADYIEFFCNFDDDDLKSYGMPGVSYPMYYGGVAYRVSGWRYTGLEKDE